MKRKFIFGDEDELKSFSLLSEERKKYCTIYQPTNGQMVSDLENVCSVNKNFKGMYGEDYVTLTSSKQPSLITIAHQYSEQTSAGEENHWKVLTASLSLISNYGRG